MQPSSIQTDSLRTCLFIILVDGCAAVFNRCSFITIDMKKLCCVLSLDDMGNDHLDAILMKSCEDLGLANNRFLSLASIFITVKPEGRT